MHAGFHLAEGRCSLFYAAHFGGYVLVLKGLEPLKKWILLGSDSSDFHFQKESSALPRCYRDRRFPGDTCDRGDEITTAGQVVG
jgi:hypothetical protein